MGLVSGGALHEEDTKSPPDAGLQHGFALSPIHTLLTSPKSDVGSNSGNSSLIIDTKPSEETEFRPPAHPRVTPGSSYTKGDTKLLKGRSSKPSLLTAEQSPPISVPTSSILPQEVTSSTESSVTVNSSDQTQRLTPLAPILTDHAIKYSESVHKVESISGSLKNERVLKPLQAENTSSKPSAVDSSKATTSGEEMKKYDVPVLSSASTAGVVASRSGNMESSMVRTGKLTSVPSPSTHRANITSNDTAMDTLTLVTDIAASPLAGEGIDSELSRAHDALLAAKPNAEQKSEVPTHLQLTARSVRDQISTESECSESGSPREGGVALQSDPPEEDLAYEGLNLQELIRAITGEELASVGREILEGSPRQEVSPTAPVVKEARKFKRTGSAPGESSRVKRKAEQSGISKQKPHLSSSREVLASSTSLRKPTAASAAHSKTKVRNVGMENNTVAATSQANRRSKLPQRAAKPSSKSEEREQYTAKAAGKAAGKNKSSHVQAKETRQVGPVSFPSSGKEGEFDGLCSLGRKADSVPSDSPQGNVVKMSSIEESLRKKVACEHGS